MPTQLCTNIGRRSGMIALQTTTGDKGVYALGPGKASYEFQFSDLIARQCRTREIVAFYPKTLTTAPSASRSRQKL